VRFSKTELQVCVQTDIKAAVRPRGRQTRYFRDSAQIIVSNDPDDELSSARNIIASMN
jgi:hypothetical protein